MPPNVSTVLRDTTAASGSEMACCGENNTGIPFNGWPPGEMCLQTGDQGQQQPAFAAGKGVHC